MVKAPEHAATWARIKMSVGPDCLTLVEDRDSGSSRRSIFAPLYPLAEWVVYNWWFLLYHSRPARSRLDLLALGRRDRHCVRAAGDGFLWPNLLIIPEGRETRLLWYRDREFGEFARIRYLSEGEGTRRTGEVERALTVLVTSVLDRLVEQGVTGTPLEKEWSALIALERDEREYCIAAAKLGLDPFSEAGEFEESIIESAQSLPQEVLGEFFDSVDPSLIPQAVEWIIDATLQAERLADASSDQIRLARDALATISARDVDVPWLLGWRQARAARLSLGLADDSSIDMEGFVPLESRVGVDPNVQAVGVAPVDSGRLAVVSGRPLVPSSRRFIQGRALWHRIARDEPTFLITTSYTHLQKAERAFAAEFLAPAEGIRSQLGVSPGDATQEDLGSVAEYFGVSPLVIEHQIENQLLR
ncbi:MAG: ImmA/IrrE family metallo-endopeptidase [Pseudonocardiaceae bacterium]